MSVFWGDVSYTIEQSSSTCLLQESLRKRGLSDWSCWSGSCCDVADTGDDDSSDGERVTSTNGSIHASIVD